MMEVLVNPSTVFLNEVEGEIAILENVGGVFKCIEDWYWSLDLRLGGLSFGELCPTSGADVTLWILVTEDEEGLF